MAKGICLLEENKRHLLYRIVLLGLGGTGSHFFRGLLQDIRTHADANKDDYKRPSFEVDITLVDADQIERKNLGNQLFTDDEIGEYKINALADRYGDFYGVEIKRVTSYCTDLDMLRKLFPVRRYGEQVQEINILIGMVDNNRSRQLFQEFFDLPEVENLIWLDSGIEGVTVLGKHNHHLTSEEKESIHTSGFSGQVVCGLKYRGQTILEPVGRIYHNILEDAHTAFPGQSCGALIINNPQRCATNKMAAQLANNYMNNLFHTFTIYTNYVNFNAQFGGSRPTFISQAAIDQYEKLKSSKYEK